MSFAFDTSQNRPDIFVQSARIEQGQSVRFNDPQRAQNIFNKIKDSIECHEDPDELKEYMRREDLILDALHLYDPALCDELFNTYESHLACLKDGLAWEAAQAAAKNSLNGNARPALPDNKTKNSNKSRIQKMNAFANFDQGATGSMGPWLSWSARGTLDGKIPRASFFIRDGDEKNKTEAFDTGVVLDIINMKTGWQKSDGTMGQAPDWKWNPDVSSMMPSPGEDFKKGFEIRCAIGGDEAVTWQQAGAGAWNTFTNLIPSLQQGPEGKLPLVKMTSTKDVTFKKGSTTEAILEVIKWVDRPDCLKEGFAAGVDAGEAETAKDKPAASNDNLEF